MGLSGAGKSTFISLLSDQEIEIGHGLESCTTKVGIYHFNYRGARVILVDTPGFDNTNRSDAEVLKDVAFWLAASYTKEVRLAGIIYLHRITDARMQSSALRNLRMLRNLCGVTNLESVVLVTTHWVNAKTGVHISESTGQARINEFWGAMIKRGSRAERHDGSKQSALRIVGEIIDRQFRVVLDIQRQLVDQGMNLDDTDAGQALHSELTAEKEKFKAISLELKDDLEFTIREKDNEREQIIKAYQAQNEADIAKAQAESLTLQTNLQNIVKEKEEEFRRIRDETAEQYRKNKQQIKAVTKALEVMKADQHQRFIEYERQQEERQRKFIEFETQMQEKKKTQGAQMEKDKKELQRQQQQLEELRAAAEARWESQDRIDRQREERLAKEMTDAYSKAQKIESEQNKRAWYNPSRWFDGKY
ncbi:P-loop containing nucleoside triphosphate hydrolase [Hyaloscypha variabilis]